MKAVENTVDYLIRRIPIDPVAAMQDLNPDFVDKERCRAWVLSRLHTGVPKCPRCGRELGRDLWPDFLAMKVIRCPGCSRRFTALSGTFLHGSKLSFQQLFLMLVLMAAGLGDCEIGTRVGVDRSTVWAYRKRWGRARVLKPGESSERG